MCYIKGAFSFFLFCLVASENVTEHPDTPEYIIPCYKSDPELNKCVTNTFNHLRPYLINGIKDINVPSIDPFKIERIVIENGQGPFRIRASFFNVTAGGASNYSIQSVNADVDRYTIELGVKLPRIEIRGKYDVNGNVLLFPVRSKGDFWAIFLDIDAAAKIYGKEIKNKEGVRFMKIDKMFVDFRFSKSRFRIKDIINHGNVIGEAMNQFLNNNSEEIIKEMKPAATTAIAKHFKTFLNAAFLRLPLKVWLPDA
ncbi:circadian clock-controlled protein daywake-like [Coccinella septempunctata]|uniref:circadian clock-controlled protein daywake-like n=1 Tax=Coccinella septempunctata TaxID=41139 RepID=UPI001D060697|nr:circadian clock-controlled protein daywake-like [Coccinella septempunctata]